MDARPKKKRGAVAVSSGRESAHGGQPLDAIADQVSEERVRLARDLHDWLLQSLTGVALDLQSLHRLVASDPAKAKARIARIQEAVANEQRELRTFIEDLQLTRPLDGEPPTLSDRLTGLARRFRDQWDLDVELQFDPVVHLAPEEIQAEIYALVTEAVSNAAKHSGGTRVSVDVRKNETGVCVRIEDDGKGFRFLGRFTLAQLVELKRGPVTLKERIQSLGGDMLVSSTTKGVVVEARIPLKRGSGDGDSASDRG
jgi:signal transduction histidine kinase